MTLYNQIQNRVNIWLGLGRWWM